MEKGLRVTPGHAYYQDRCKYGWYKQSACLIDGVEKASVIAVVVSVGAVQVFFFSLLPAVYGYIWIYMDRTQQNGSTCHSWYIDALLIGVPPHKQTHTHTTQPPRGVLRWPRQRREAKHLAQRVPGNSIPYHANGAPHRVTFRVSLLETKTTKHRVTGCKHMSGLSWFIITIIIISIIIMTIIIMKIIIMTIIILTIIMIRGLCWLKEQNNVSTPLAPTRGEDLQIIPCLQFYG